MTETELTPRFCSSCGSPLEARYIAADHATRMICASCGAIAYRNPAILVTTIIEAQGQILLCRRAEPPRAGYWTLPGGFMECGESLEEAAVREALEETGIALDVRDLRFYGISSVVDIDQVYVGFMTRLERKVVPVCGSECEEVRYFAEQEIPWKSLAFPDMERYLRSFLGENRLGEECIHFGHLNAGTALRDIFAIADITRSYLHRDADGE